MGMTFNEIIRTLAGSNDAAKTQVNEMYDIVYVGCGTPRRLHVRLTDFKYTSSNELYIRPSSIEFDHCVIIDPSLAIYEFDDDVYEPESAVYIRTVASLDDVQFFYDDNVPDLNAIFKSTPYGMPSKRYCVSDIRIEVDDPTRVYGLLSALPTCLDSERKALSLIADYYTFEF